MSHQAKKRFGQNFLKDKNLLMKIVKESNILNKNVIEVGPGQGALTTFLALTAKKVICYEIDLDLKPILSSLEAKFENLEVYYEDFLNTDLTKLEGEWHVVANVPYYITTPILFKILETKQIKSASLMVQKEVIDRLIALPNTKQYNALSIILKYHAEVHKMMDVKRHMFQPIPNVDSAVIRVIKRDEPLLDQSLEKLFLKIVKESFKQKRKTILNNLSQGFEIKKDQLIEFLQKNQINPSIRAEGLSLEDFLTLTKVWDL